MVQIPTAEQLGARPLPPRQPGVQQADPLTGQITAGTGRAISRLGEAVAGFAQIEREKVDKRRTYNNQTSWLNFNVQTDSALSSSMQNEFDADTGAFDFVDRTMNAFDQSAQSFFQNLGPEATQEEVGRWQVAFDQKRFEVHQTAQKFQDEEQRRYYLNDLQGQLDITLAEIDKNPDSFATWNKMFMDSLDASGLTARDKNKLRRTISKEIVTATVNGFIGQKRFTEAQELLEAYADASDQDGRAASSNNPIVNRIIQIGETGERIKTTPNEAGTGNMSDRRWLQLLEQYRPDILDAYGEDEQGLLDLRGEPRLVQELVADETEFNANELDKLDIDPTPANLYLASVFGLRSDGGVQSILDSDDATALSAIVPNEVYAQNRKLFEGKTVGWLKKYAQTKMVTESGPDTKVTSADRLYTGPAFTNELRGKISAAQTRYVDALATKRKGDYELAIANDPFAVTPQQINNDASLGSAQKASLINTLRSRQKEANKKRQVMARIEFAPKSLDPANKEDRDGVDTYFTQQLQETRGIYASLNEEFTPNDVIRIGVEVTKRTGIAPPQLVKQIASGIRSLDRNEVTASYEMALRLTRASGTATMGQGSDKQIRDAATDWALAIEHFNMTVDRATDYVIQINDPTKEQTQKALTELANENLKNKTFNNFAGDFDKYALGDTLWFYEGLTVGRGTDGDEALFAADWKTLYTQNLIAANGDDEIARARTAKDMRRIYSPTVLGAPGSQVVRNSVESQYPNMDPEVIREDSYQDVVAVMGDQAPPMEDVFLIASDVTRQDIREGRNPRYMQMYRAEDPDTGQYDFKAVPGGGLYTPPPKDSTEYQQAAEERFRKAAAAERYITGAGEEENILFDRNTNRWVRFNEDGSVTPLHAVDDQETPEIRPGNSVPIAGTRIRAPVREDAEQPSAVGAQTSIETLAGGLLDAAQMVRGRAPGARIPLPRRKGQEKPSLLEQAVKGFQDISRLRTGLEEPEQVTDGVRIPAQATIAAVREGKVDALNDEALDNLSRVELATLLNGEMTTAERLARSPSSRTPQFTGTGLSGRIISVESSGQATAKNPRSTAYGAGQFINSTWLGLIRKYRPDLAEGRDKDQILALRSDPNLSAQMVDRYAEENTRVLERAGLPVTAGNIYMLHFLGPQQGRRVLKAKDQVPLSRLLTKSVLEANPRIKGKDAGWLKRWAARKMG